MNFDKVNLDDYSIEYKELFRQLILPNTESPYGSKIVSRYIDTTTGELTELGKEKGAVLDEYLNASYVPTDYVFFTKSIGSESYKDFVAARLTAFNAALKDCTVVWSDSSMTNYYTGHFESSNTDIDWSLYPNWSTVVDGMCPNASAGMIDIFDKYLQGLEITQDDFDPDFDIYSGVVDAGHIRPVNQLIDMRLYPNGYNNDFLKLAWYQFRNMVLVYIGKRFTFRNTEYAERETLYYIYPDEEHYSSYAFPNTPYPALS